MVILAPGWKSVSRNGPVPDGAVLIWSIRSFGEDSGPAVCQCDRQFAERLSEDQADFVASFGLGLLQGAERARRVQRQVLVVGTLDCRHHVIS